MTNTRIASERDPLEVWDLFLRRCPDDPHLLEIDDGETVWLLDRHDAARMARMLGRFLEPTGDI